MVASVHGIADQIFRAVIEDWVTSNGGGRQAARPIVFDDVPRSTEREPLGLLPWEGIYHGSRVLVSLLRLLQRFVLSQTSQLVNLPLGLLLDLSSRLLHIRVPTNTKESQTVVRFNAEIGRDEREELLAILPDIHRSTLDLLSSLVEATGPAILPLSSTIVDQCVWVFASENSNEGIRLTSYKLLERLMPLIGPSITKDTLKPLSGLIDLCCKDVSRCLENETMVQSKAGTDPKHPLNGHADSFLHTSSRMAPRSQSQLFQLENAASRLLCQMLEYVAAPVVPHSLRAQIDRTAILKDQKQIMLASVLNPAPKTTGKYAAPSIMPFLARAAQDELEVECLLRPRMPVVREAKKTPCNREAESDEDIQTDDSKDPETADGRSTGTPFHPINDSSGTQNDLLDRFEGSIEDGTIAASKAETPQTVGVNQAFIEPHPQATDGSPYGTSPNQGAKRNLDTVGFHGYQESNKRLRSGELNLELKPELVTSLEDTTASNSAVSPAVIDPEPAIPVELGVGATIIDKGKGRATNISSRLEGIGALGEENIGDDDDDDESDSDIPPLYLKTTDSEMEEEDEEDEDML